MGCTRFLVDGVGRECSICEEYKPWANFGILAKGVRGHRSQCKGCFSILQKKYRYGLLPRKYKEMKRRAGDICEICGNERELVLDHCHKTSVIRGLICNRCNMGLGLVDDSSTRLIKLMGYLKSGAAAACDKTRIGESRTMRETDLHRRYGILENEYQEILLEQGGSCAVCERRSSGKGRLAVDHNHDQGFIRGLLCTHCNSSLGQFNDSIESIQRAVTYLERSELNEFSRRNSSCRNL